MSAGPANPVDRLEQAAKQFKDSGVIQLAVEDSCSKRSPETCAGATRPGSGCVELSAEPGDTRAERRKRIVDAQITLISTLHGEYTRYTKYGRNL